MTRPNSVSRLRLIALLLVAAFSISAVAVASSSLVEPASAAKKSKKCKKGYKKSKGKCKKVKKKSTSVKVTAVNVKLATSNNGQVKVNGLIKTNVSSRKQLNGEISVTVGGSTQKVAAVFSIGGSAASPFSKLVETSFVDTDGGTLTVTVGGVTSPPATIK